MSRTYQVRPGRRAAGALAPAGGILAFLLLAGCSVYDSIFGSNLPPLPCPPVSVLGDASLLTRFREGDGRDLIDVLYGGEIGAVETSCEYSLNEDTGAAGWLSVEVAPVIFAERGPADRERRAVYPYFVTVVDAERRVLNKQTFDLVVEFPRNRTRTTVVDKPPVALTIPLKEGVRGDSFEVFIGFQLSREELDFNRRRRARGR